MSLHYGLYQVEYHLGQVMIDSDTAKTISTFIKLVRDTFLIRLPTCLSVFHPNLFAHFTLPTRHVRIRL